ncbi:MAG: transglutaminase domain-containing protein, partial [Bacteroidaceae bacterium]|nr:transglutaminase domain-containing protein [Bacteroidaceae bacterium]
MKKAFLLLLFATALVSCGTRQEDKYLAFLYRYMPLPDSVDYPRTFWEQNVALALQARREMPWGRTVPEREWRHFVLPVRVNNENLDTARAYIYNVLRERVRDLSMYDAVLEVNHWCHEHATYQPSDSRTSSPLATIRSGIGRCGEESTLCVAALRAVGIPARQVYTPRWAHTDDNHAWVEAWVDGTWHFLGACEPEPVLDKGWFNEPASRGMLMHTRVFGSYDGPEDVVSRNACYTEINVTAHYAPVASLHVCVVDSDSCAVEGAAVDFRLYNYGEFYPLCTMTADAEGCASLTCGLGDLLVWARHDGHFGYAKASVGKDEEVTVVLDNIYSNYSDYNFIPPVPHDNLPPVTPEQDAANKERLLYEDSLRQAYADTAFCRDGDEALIAARANWRTIQRFKEDYPDHSATVLAALSRKDFRDVPYDVLQDFALSGQGPRVANELLTPWYTPLHACFGGMSASDVMRWVGDSIVCDDSRNPQHLCMSPLGVLRHRTTDTHSRDIFLVAALRAAGHDARLDEVTGQVMVEGASQPSRGEELNGQLILTPSPRGGQGVGASTPSPRGGQEVGASTPSPQGGQGGGSPIYYRHFTLSRIASDGSLQLMEYPEDIDAAYFATGVDVEPGRYLLTTGQRLASGAVLSRLSFFNVKPGETTSVPLIVRRDADEPAVIGSFDSETRYLPMGEDAPRSLLSETGRGYFVVGFLAPGQEP